MKYWEIRKQAERTVRRKIVDYRPACGLFIEGIEDHEQIPNAIVCWLNNGDKIIYIAHEEDKHDN